MSYNPANPMDKREIREFSRRHVWQPFTQMADWLEEEPIVISSGKGCVLKDMEGKEYIDGYSSMWVNVLGHSHPGINDGIRSQLDKIAHSTMLGLSNEVAAEAAKSLLEVVPKNLTRVFFSDNGSTAMEIALKMAFQYWRNVEPDAPVRDTFVGLEEGYHGDTVGAMSLGGVALFRDVYRPLLFRSLQIPAPYPYRSEYGPDPEDVRRECLRRAEEIISANEERICAVAMEPLVQCAGNFIVHPRGFLRGISEICRRHGIPLILDEVATGFGRTGKMFACEHEDVEPDIMALSKGITGGYLPFAVTLASERIFEAFLGGYEKTLYHGHSYTGNQLGCAAAVATMKAFREELVIENLQPKIAVMSELLREFDGLGLVGETRQCGFIGVIEVVRDKGTKEKHPYEEKIGWRIVKPLREKGILLRPLDNIVYVMPPYCITEEQLRHVFGALKEKMIEME